MHNLVPFKESTRIILNCVATVTRRFFGCAVLMATAAAACGPVGQTPPRRQVRVAAAADLNAALGDLIARFSAARSVDVTVSYGSSGTFYAQLLNQAPFDVFFSADVHYPQQLAARGLIVPGTEFVYAIGRLVVWVPANSTLDVDRRGVAALGGDARLAHVAIANPEHAPYGRAAVAALQSAGVYDQVRPKLVFGENVAQALQFVQTGAADAGLVALSLAMASTVRDKGRWIDVPIDSYPRLEQGGAILKWAADVDAARALRAFVLGTEGRTILREYGFSIPER
jgi:molybdate transport system substrate-binding protein